TAEPPKEAAKTTEPGASKVEELPPYYSGANPKEKDPKTGKEGEKPLWPDPTRNNAGVWATPSGAPKEEKAADGTTVQKPAGDDPKTLSLTDVSDRVVRNLFSINMVWTLVTGFLVMFMQAGFALVETGLCRAKNAGHTMSMNFMIYPLGCISFFV